MNIHSKPNIKKEPWNKGKKVGQKHPFPADTIPVVRHFLKDQPRDLALFNLSVDTMLRGSDLLMLKVEDVASSNGEILKEGITGQKKTRDGVSFALNDKCRAALKAWIEHSGKGSSDFLFTSIRKDTAGRPLSGTQYRRLVKKWAESAGLDPRQFSGHSTRRTKSSVIYERTQNLAACQQLLGHKSIASTALYLGVDKRKALDLAKETDV